MKQHLHALEALAAELESRGLKMPAAVHLYVDDDCATVSAVYHSGPRALPPDLPWSIIGNGIPVIRTDRDGVDITIQANSEEAVAA